MDSAESELGREFFGQNQRRKEDQNSPFCEIVELATACIVRRHTIDPSKTRGGVWADATLWCARPLDDWIDEACQKSGFFCYVHTDRPEIVLRNRLIGTWFLAAVPDSRIVSLWHAAAMRLMIKGKLSSVLGTFGEGLSSRLMPQLTGLSVPTSDRLDDKHYFFFHRLFQLCLDNNSEFRRLWLSMPKLSTAGPDALGRFGLLKKPVNMDALAHILHMKANVYKLTRRVVIPSDVSGTLLDALYRSHPSGDSA